jgi:hypothetical protein
MARPELNSEPQNVECRTAECRSVVSLCSVLLIKRIPRSSAAGSFIKMDRSTQRLSTGRIHSFDIRYSLFILYVIRQSQSLFSIRLAVFQASGGARMKLHEIQCHFYKIPHSVTEYRLRRRPRPYKIMIYEDEDEKNQIRSYAFALRPQPYTLYLLPLCFALRLFLFSAFRIPTSEFLDT